MNASAPAARRLAVLVLVALLAAASWSRVPDDVAQDRLDQGLKAAFAAFATARALNAVISLVQSGQVGAQVGVGMSVAPGQLLDPVDDLVERFSDAMLAATVAFGVQKVLAAIGAHWVVPALLSAAALVWAALLAARRAPPGWLARGVALLLLVRFAVPVATIGTDAVARQFLAPGAEASRQALERLRGEAEAGTAKAASTEAGALATIRGWLARGAELGGRLDEIAAAAGSIAEHVTSLIVVFLLQTLVFPIALAWLLWRLVRTLLDPAPPGDAMRRRGSGA